jgi:hypothetical protein
MKKATQKKKMSESREKFRKRTRRKSVRSLIVVLVEHWATREGETETRHMWLEGCRARRDDDDVGNSRKNEATGK